MVVVTWCFYPSHKPTASDQVNLALPPEHAGWKDTLGLFLVVVSTFHLELEGETLSGVGKAKRPGEYQELHKIRLNWLTLFWWQSILQEGDGKGSGMGAKWVADNNP